MSAARAFVAVYRDADAAGAAAAEMSDAAPDVSVRVDHPADRVTSLRGEMREELDHTTSALPSGIVPIEMAKGVAMLVPLGAGIGALLGLAGALLADQSGFLGWAVFIGAAMGATIGAVVGAAMAARGPADQSAGHVGVPVRVSGDLPEGRVDILLRHSPMRVDEVAVADDRPMGTVATEHDQTDDGTFARLEHQLRQEPGGDWSSARGERGDRIRELNAEMEREANREPGGPWSS